MTRRRGGGDGSGLVGSGRPRAVVVQDGQRGWDPSALGQVPTYGREATEADGAPLVVGVARGWREPF